MTDLHIITLNVQGLRDKNKRFRLYEWLKCQKFHIILLQETHFTTEIINTFKNETQQKFTGYHSFGKSKSCGVSILVNVTLENHFNMLSCDVDNVGRLITLSAEIFDEKYTIVNLCAPNDFKNRNVFFKQLTCN